MSRAFLTLIPGPSRITLGLRTLHTSSCLYATNKPSRPSSTGPLPRPTVQKQTSPPVAQAGKANSRQQQWEWEPMESKSEGVKAERRVIFDRPFESTWSSNEWFLPCVSVAFLAYVGGYGVYLYKDGQVPDNVETYEGWLSDTSKYLLNWVAPPAILVTGSILFHMGRAQLRSITRMSLIRVTPTDPAVGPPAKQFVRVQTGGHLISLGFKRFRDIDPKKSTLYILPGARVRLDVGPGKKNMGYEMDFRETKRLKEHQGNVVLSKYRLEKVFGAMRPLTAEARDAVSSTAKIWKFLDKNIMSQASRKA